MWEFVTAAVENQYMRSLSHIHSSLVHKRAFSSWHISVLYLVHFIAYIIFSKEPYAISAHITGVSFSPLKILHKRLLVAKGEMVKGGQKA